MEQLCPLHSEIKMKKGNQPESSRGGCWQCDPAAGAGAHPAALEPPPPTLRTPDRGRRAGRLALPGFVSRARLAALWGHRVVVVNSAASGVDFFFFCDRGRWEADYQHPAGSGWKATDTKVVAGSAPGVEGRSPWTLRKAVCSAGDRSSEPNFFVFNFISCGVSWTAAVAL